MTHMYTLLQRTRAWLMVPLLVLLTSFGAFAQTYLSQDFEGAFSAGTAPLVAPAGWTQTDLSLTSTTSGDRSWTRFQLGGDFTSATPAGPVAGNATGRPAAFRPGGSGNGVLGLNEFNYTNGGIKRINTGNINLTGSTNPVVRFWIQYYNTIRQNLAVVASNDGGATWVTLQHIVVQTNSTVNWEPINVDIPAAYRTANAQFGFQHYATFASGDVYIDDFTVQEAPAYTTTTYTGASGGNWNVAASWSGGTIPNADQHVVIPNGSAVVIPATYVARCRNLTIDATGVLSYNSTTSSYLWAAGNASISGLFHVGTAASATGTLFLGGNLTVNSGGTINLTSAATATGATLHLMGSTPQTFTNNGTVSTADAGKLLSLFVSNVSGVSFASPLTVKSALGLINGPVNGTNLNIGNNTTITGSYTNTITRYRGSFSSTPTFAPSRLATPNHVISVSYSEANTSGISGYFPMGAPVTLTTGAEIPDENISGNIFNISGTLTVNTFGNVALGKAVTIGDQNTANTTSSLTLTRGILISTATNLLRLNSDIGGSFFLTAPSIALGATSAGSYVSGPLRRTFLSTSTSAFTFPLGVGTNSLAIPFPVATGIQPPVANTYRPFTFNAGGTAWGTLDLTVQIVNTPPAGAGPPQGVRFYQVTRNAGDLSAVATVTMGVLNSAAPVPTTNGDNITAARENTILAQATDPLSATWVARSAAFSAGTFTANTRADITSTAGVGPLATNGEFFAWLNTTPNCQPPATASGIGTAPTTATLNWASSVSSVNGYAYEVRSSGAAGSGPAGLAASGSVPSPATLTANVTGLTANTVYTVHVRTICDPAEPGPTFTWRTGAATFTTPCDPTPLPLLVTAEGVTTPALPSCVTSQIVTGTAGFISNTSHGRNASTRSITITWGTKDVWLYMPPFNVTNGVNYTVVLPHRNSSSYSFQSDRWSVQLAYGASPVNTAMTNVISNFFPNCASTTYNDTTFTFVANTTGTIYLGIRAQVPGSTPNLLVFDDIEVFATPTCFRPTGVTANAVSNNVSFSWITPSQGTPVGYQYEVRSSGAPGSGATGLDASGSVGLVNTATSASTLTASTTYTLYVRSNCGAEQSAWSTGIVFTTACAPTPLPLIVTAEGVTTPALPACIATQVVTGAANYISNASFGRNASTRSISITWGTKDVWLYLPPFNVTNGTSYTLVLPHRNSSSYAFQEERWNVQLAYGTRPVNTAMTNIISNFFPNCASTTYNDTTFTFTANTTGTIFLGVRAQLTGSTPNLLVFDDIEVFATPTCFRPTGIVAAPGNTNVTLSWTTPTQGTPVGYQYEVRSSGAPGSGATGLEASGSVGLVNTATSASTLTASTAYTAYVRTNCGAEQSFWTAGTAFTTQCNPVAAPLTEGAEGIVTVGSGIVPTCWSTARITGTNWASTSTNPRTGTRALVATSGSSSSLWLAPLTLTAGQAYTFSYWIRSSSTTGLWSITPVVNTAPVMTGATALATSYDIASTTYAQNVFTFEPTVTGTYNFGINVTDNNGSFNLYVDDFEVTALAGCVTPGSITASAVLPTTLTLNWPQRSSATSGYQYEIRTSGAAGSGATGLVQSGSTGAGVNTQAITGLTQATAYTIHVRSNCGSGNFSAWASGAVTTPCNPVAIPYSEGAEGIVTTGTGIVPTCWSTVRISGTNWGSTTTNPLTGTKALVAESGSSSSLWLPPMTLTAGRTYGFSYWMRSSSTTGLWSIIPVVNTTTSVTGATTLAASYDVASTTYAQFTFYYNATTTGVYHFGINVPSGGGSFNLYVDDFSVTEVPCAAIVAPVVGTLTPTSAVINWPAVPNATAGFNYQTSTDGGVTWSGILTRPAGSTSVTLSGLVQGTNYQFRIRPMCAQTGNFTTISFSTPCVAAALPYSENFDALGATGGAGILPTCWTSITVTGSAANSFRSGTFFPRSGTNSLWFNWSSNAAVVLPAMTLTAGQTYSFSFWGRNQDAVTGQFVKMKVNTLPTLAGSSNLVVPFSNLTTPSTASATYAQYRASFTPTTTGTYYFIAQDSVPSSSPNGFNMDDFSVRLNTCPSDPSALAVGVTTLNSAPLTWTQNAVLPSIGYEYVVLAATSPVPDFGSAATGSFGLGTSGTVTGLTAGRKYDIYLRANCTGGKGDWIGPVLATTTCENTVPSLETFEQLVGSGSPIDFPACWVQSATTGNFFSENDAAFDHTPGGSKHLTASLPSFSSANMTMITKGYALTGGVTYGVGIWYNSSNGTNAVNASLALRQNSTASTTGMVTLGTPTPITASIQPYTYVFQTFTPATTGTYFFGIQVTSSSVSNTTFIDLDDFTVELAPCPSVPTALALASATSATANFTFTPSANVPSNGYDWIVVLGNQNESATPTASGNVTGSPVAVTGLSGNTAYRYYMRGNCGATQSSWIGPVPFTTECSATAAPLLESFESITTPGLSVVPNCWRTVQTVGVNWTSQTSASLSRTGTKSMRIGPSSNNRIWAAGVALTAGTTYDLSFYLRASAVTTGYTMTVFGNLDRTATAVAPVINATLAITSTSIGTSYSRFAYAFTAPSTGTYFFGINMNVTSTTATVYLDDFEVKERICGVSPTPVFAGASPTSANFTFTGITPPPTPTNYDYVVVAVDALPGTGTIQTVPFGNTSFTTAGTLTASTSYDLYFRNNCPGGTADWAGPVRFTTACAPITVPVSYNSSAEGVTTPNLPACFTSESVTGSSNWVSSTTNPRTGARSWSLSTTNEDILWLPPMTLAAAANYQFSVWNRASFSTTTNTLELLVNPNGVNSVVGSVSLGAFNNTSAPSVGSTTYTQFSGTYQAATTATYVFGIRGLASGSTSLLDDIQVKLVPCGAPPVPVVGVTTATTASFTFTAPTTLPSVGYETVVVFRGSPVSAGIPVAVAGGPGATSFTRTGLGANTLLDLYIRNVCTGSLFSDWSSPIPFTTQCNTLSIPFTEGFESGLGCFKASVVSGASTSIFLEGRLRTASGNTPVPPALTGGGNSLLRFNSNTASAGEVRRLTSPPLNYTGKKPEVNFDFYHGTEFSDRDDRVQVQYSINGGTTWIDALTAVSRYRVTDGWTKYYVGILDAAAENNPSLLIALTFTSEFGRDIYVDNLSFTDRSTTTRYIWTGATSTAWATATNWLYVGGAPTGGENVTLLANAPNQPTLPAAPQIVGDLNIRGSSTVTIPAGQSLTINGNLTGVNSTITGGPVNFGGAISTISGQVRVNGDVTVNTNSLTVNNGANLIIGAPNTLTVAAGRTLSTAGTGVVTLTSTSPTSTARLGDMTGATFSGNLTLQRKTAGTGGWYFLGAPFTSATTLSQWSELGLRTTPINNANAFYYTENDTTGTRLGTNGPFYARDGWKIIPSTTGPINPGNNPRGYRIYLGNTFNAAGSLLSTTGAPIVGNVVVPVTKSANGFTSIVADPAGQGGWNLIANPYPSQIDAQAFLTETANDALLENIAYWTWDPNKVGGAGYITWSLIDPPTSRHIASSQAFYIRASGSGNMGFQESFKSSSASTFLRSTTLDPNTLKVSVASGTNSDFAMIGFRSFGNNMRDRYDAPKLDGSTINVSSLMAPNLNFYANVLAPLTAQIVVPIKVTTPSVGSHTFTVEGVETFDVGQQVYLRDKLLGTMTDLTVSPTYTFDVTSAPNTQGTSRFELVFAPASVTVVKSDLSAGISVWPNPASGADRLNVSLTHIRADKAVVTLIDALGRPVERKEVNTNNGVAETNFNIKGLAAGVYILRAQTGKATLVKEVIVK